MAFQDRLLERVRALPGVTEAGLVSNLPMSRSSSVRRFRVVGGGGTGAGSAAATSSGISTTAPAPGSTTTGVPSTTGAPTTAGVPTTAGALTAGPVPATAPVEGNAAWRPATPGYFRAMRIPLLRGRAFTDADREGAPRVVLVSRSLARRYFPDGDVLGRRIATGEEWEVVGVVGDVADTARNGFQPTIYAPHAQAPRPTRSSPSARPATPRRSRPPSAARSAPRP